jgi:hypothetical protein
VEDRLTRGLYLEMTERPLDAYARDRVPEVLAQTGVERATWWRNVKRDRDDLPRVLDEFDHLGIYEVDDTFRAPAVPDGIRAHHFVRTPRPGQGVITGRPTIGLSLVLISPKEPAEAQALRDWADFVHIRHVAAAAVPGFTLITPYENVVRARPRFLHLYELDTDAAEEAFQRMTPATLARLPGREERRAWAGHPELVIDYVSTFRFAGAQPAVMPASIALSAPFTRPDASETR